MRPNAPVMLVAAFGLPIALALPARAGDAPLPALHRHDIAPTTLDTGLGGSDDGSIAVIGDRIVLSSGPRWQSCPGCDVVVYRRSAEPGVGEGWRRETGLRELVPASEASISGFGAAVATGSSVGGDWIFVSKPGFPAEVHVFRLAPVFRLGADESDWEHRQVLTLTEGNGGQSIAFDGERLVVGAPFRDPVPGDFSGGSADIFTLAGDRFEGPSSLSMPFQPSILGTFGHAVAIDGDTVVLAAATGGGLGFFNMGLVATFVLGSDGQWQYEGLLTSTQPVAQGRFGADVAMRDGLLAVVAPNESKPMPEGGMSKGIVYLFRRDASGWTPEGAIADSGGPGAGVQRVVMHDDLLATGRPAFASDGASGLVSLYRVGVGTPPERLFRTGRSAEFGNDYSSSGARVAIGSEWIAFTRRQSWYDSALPVVRALPLANALATCGTSRLLNGAAILEGDAPDCDDDLIPDACAPDCEGNGVPDACAVLFAEAASAPTEPIGWWLGLTGEGTGIVMTRITVPSWSDGVVRGVVADWSVALPSNASAGLWAGSVALYADPDGDGDPTDALLLGHWPIEWSLPGGIERISLPPSLVAEPGASFFVGLITERRFGGTGSIGAPLLRMAAAGAEGFVTWTATYPPGEFDPTIPIPPNAAPWGESFPNAPNVFCAALFASPVDTDVDGTPDACACDGDLDGDGAVGPADLALLLGAWGTGSAGADLDGDGTVGPSDLAMLLGAWGACRGG